MILNTIEKMKQLFTNSIRTRTISILIILFIAEIFLINTVLNNVMIPKIDMLETNYVKDNLARSENAVNNQLKTLATLAYDWGIWDASYDYVTGQDPTFSEINLPDDTFGNLNVHIMAYLDNQGQYVYSKQYDTSSNQVETIDPNIIAGLNTIKMLQSQDPESKCQGLISLPDGLMMVAVSPVMHNGAKGDVGGHFIVGRYLNQETVASLRNDLNLDLYVEDNNTLGAENMAYRQHLSSSQPTHIDTVNLDHISGHTLLSDLDGNPVGMLTIILPRDVSKIGYSGINAVMGYLLVSVMLFIIIATLLLDKGVLRRLVLMRGQLLQIAQSDLQRLSDDQADDEIALVSKSINHLLDQEEKLYHGLQKAHDELETRVAERTAELNTANASLQAEIEKRQEIQEKITHLAYHDHLTDLPNRLLFTELLTHAMAISQRTGKILSVLFLDLDGFKMINDTLGHDAGDQLLKMVANRLTDTLRVSDTMARLGGDEFIILVENIGQMDAIDIIAQKILHSFDYPFTMESNSCFLTTSIGIAVYPIDGKDAESLIKNADIAMYGAKEQGKNQYAYCTSVMKECVLENMRLSNYLFRAIEKNELEVYYQPQVNSETRTIVGLEALLRWHHPTEGTIAPGVFIPLAEQTGLIISIGEWVLRETCRQNQAWQNAGLPCLKVAVNVSVRQLHNNNLIQTVQDVLSETGMDPKYLELEITESAIMKDHRNVVDVLTTLKNMGIKIAIDDFGTEYSSLNYIKSLPVDRIKIAMPFIHGIDVNEKDEAIVKAIIVLAKSLDLNVIAEGVETCTQLTFLSQRMCEEVQGFLYYKPMPAAQIEELLRGNTRDFEPQVYDSYPQTQMG